MFYNMVLIFLLVWPLLIINAAAIELSRHMDID